MVAAGRDICHFSSRKLILPKDNDMRKISCCQPSSYIVCIVGKKECIGINSVERKMTFISNFFQPKAIFFLFQPQSAPLTFALRGIFRYLVQYSPKTLSERWKLL